MFAVGACKAVGLAQVRKLVPPCDNLPPFAPLLALALQVTVIGVSGDLSQRYLLKALARLHSAVEHGVELQIHGVRGLALPGLSCKGND